MKIFEVSKEQVADSWAPDLVKSKTWLADELAKIRTQYDTIYVLGSWYGNMGVILFQERDIRFNRMYNVDVNRASLELGQELVKDLGLDIQAIQANANYLNYNKPSLVINTSINNIENAGWFENIPQGTLVVLQSRNKDPQSINDCNSPAELAAQYPLANVLYMDKLRLTNEHGSYARFMVIGVK
jgi:hypothetical protein